MEQPRDKLGKFLPIYDQWYLRSKDNGLKYKVGYFDIEFTDLAANFGFITAWSIKTRDSSELYNQVITQKDIINKTFDKNLVKDFCRVAKQYDLLIGYYSSMCDVPYLRSRAMKYNFDFPTQRTINHIDLYFAVRGKVQTNRKSLKVITKFLGIKGKVDLTDEEWMLCKIGDPDALAKLEERNKFDCIILEKLHKRFEPYVKFNKGWI